VIEVLQGAAASFGFIFVVAGVAKLDNWRDWNETLGNLLPSRPGARAIGRFLPTLELAAGALALIRPALGLLACGTLLVALGFSAGFFSLSHSGEACNCFGAVMPSQIGARLAVRNVGLGIAALGLAWYAERLGVPRLGLLEVAAATFAAVLLLSLIGLKEFRDVALRRTKGAGRWA
jgi:hypothetical protein